jgi:hypothetical protein
MSFTTEDLEAFLSKTDFDFSTVGGWEEFLSERRRGGSGRDADGVQLRDIKNYAVGTANIISTGSPDNVHINIRQSGTGLALAPAQLYVNFPDASGARQVREFGLGGSTQASADFFFDAGGGGTRFSPHWNVIYYIVIKVGDLPGRGLAERHGRRVLEQAIKGGGWMLRRGFGLLRYGGASYDVTVKVGNLPPARNQFLDQEILSDEGMAAIREGASDAWDYIRQ